VIISIVLVHRNVFLVLDKTNKSGNVKLFGEIFYIKSEIYNHFISIVWISIADEERTCNFTYDATLKFHDLLNILVPEKGFCLLHFFRFLAEKLRYMLFTHKRIMKLSFLSCCVKIYFYNLGPSVNICNFTIKSKLVKS